MLGEKNDGAEVQPEDDVAARDGLPKPTPVRCPPPRWATGLRRVLYPDVTIGCGEEEPDVPTGS